ncbi:MAG: PspA/IM30 family protein [Nitrososphaera sp.]
MGLGNRISSVIKQKVNALLDKYEDPREALDYSYTQQLEMLNKLRRSIAEVVTAKKRLEMQKLKLVDNIRTLDEQARRAVDANREDLARLALERKNANLVQMQSLDKQITDMQAEQQKLENSEKQTALKVEEFRTKKEVIKAQYSAAEASVKIKESVTGISEQMNDVGMAMNRAEDKTEKMKARSQALDDMIDSGVLTDYTSNKDEIERELEKVSVQSSVDEELAKIKAEQAKKGKKKNSDASDSSTDTSAQTEQEAQVQ